MNGHIVGDSPSTLELRDGKTRRWTNCTGRAWKNQERAAGAAPAPPQTSRPSRGCGRRPVGVRLPAAASPSRDAPRGLRGAGEGARCPPERVGPPAARLPSPHPRAAPRAPRPAPAGGLGYRPRSGRMHGRRRRRGGRGAGSDRAPGGASAPLTQLSASLLSLTFLHRLPGTSMAAAPAPGSQNRPGRATRTLAGQGRAGRAGGGAFASGLARADVRTRSCSRLRLRRVAAAPPKWVRGRGTCGGAKRTRRTLRPPGSEEGAGPGKAVLERPACSPALRMRRDWARARLRGVRRSC